MKAQETGMRSTLGHNECGSGRSGHQRLLCVIHRCIQLHFAQSSQGGRLLGDFPLVRAHQKRLVPQPVTMKVHD